MTTKSDLLALSRTEVREATTCPICRADPGERCIGARGKPRERNHLERVQLAIALAEARR